MRRLALIAGAAAFVVGACGSSGSDPTESDAPEAPLTQATVTVDLGEGAAVQEAEVECTGVDGPEAEVCSGLVAADPGLFEPVPADQACTMIYGGPERIQVAGSVEGQSIEAEFTRENGCEIDRYETVAEILAPLDLTLIGDPLAP